MPDSKRTKRPEPIRSSTPMLSNQDVRPRTSVNPSNVRPRSNHLRRGDAGTPSFAPTRSSASRNSIPVGLTYAATPSLGERRNSLPGLQPLTSVGVSDADVYLRIDNDPNAVRVKGINFIAFLEAISKCHGAAARLELEKRLGGEIGDALRFGGIVAGGWYKVSWYRILWRTTTDQLGLDEPGARRLSHKATAYSVNIVYRTLAKLANPAMLIDACARVYGTYFDKGQLVVLSSQPGNVTVEWTRCNGFDVFLWNHVVASSAFFLESAGATAVQGNVLGGGGDNNWLRATFTYQ